MKAFELMATFNNGKQLLLDEELDIDAPSRVKVIILVSDEDEIDPNDTPLNEVKASLKRALQEAKEGKRIPLEQMWERIDAE